MGSRTVGAGEGQRWNPPQRLTRSFFERPATEVAPDLIGKVLWHESRGGLAALRIVETEAYGGEGDPGSHGYRGMTPRNTVMFGEPGRAYIYFTYGMHHCLNFVTDRDGICSAVLIRAGEPLTGLELMASRRSRDVEEITELASGPGKLTQALGLTRDENGSDLMAGPIGVGQSASGPVEIVTARRVGIRHGAELEWRYAAGRSEFVSRPRPK